MVRNFPTWEKPDTPAFRWESASSVLGTLKSVFRLRRIGRHRRRTSQALRAVAETCRFHPSDRSSESTQRLVRQPLASMGMPRINRFQETINERRLEDCFTVAALISLVALESGFTTRGERNARSRRKPWQPSPEYRQPFLQ